MRSGRKPNCGDKVGSCRGGRVSVNDGREGCVIVDINSNRLSADLRAEMISREDRGRNPQSENGRCGDGKHDLGLGSAAEKERLIPGPWPCHVAGRQNLPPPIRAPSSPASYAASVNSAHPGRFRET